MTGLMSLFYKENKIIIIGCALVITNILCIRNPFLVSKNGQNKKSLIFYFAHTIQIKYDSSSFKIGFLCDFQMIIHISIKYI